MPFLCLSLLHISPNSPRGCTQVVPPSLTMLWSTRFSDARLYIVSWSSALVWRGRWDLRGRGVFRGCQNESPAVRTKMSPPAPTNVPRCPQRCFLAHVPHLPRGSQFPAGELLKVVLHHRPLTTITFLISAFSQNWGQLFSSAVSHARAQSPGAAGSCPCMLSSYFWDVSPNVYVFSCPEQEDEPCLCHNVLDAGFWFGRRHPFLQIIQISPKRLSSAFKKSTVLWTKLLMQTIIKWIIWSIEAKPQSSSATLRLGFRL